jgi:hypothetical protein
VTSRDHDEEPRKVESPTPHGENMRQEAAQRTLRRSRRGEVNKAGRLAKKHQ